MQAGEDAVTKLNINGLHAEIIKLSAARVGRFSYNQNVLDHQDGFSLAPGDAGFDPNVAKRAAPNDSAWPGRRGEPCP